MAGPGRDMRGNREPTIKVAVILPIAMVNALNSFRHSRAREIDNFSHALRIIIQEGINEIEDEKAPESALIRNEIPNGSGKRKEFTLPVEIHEKIDTYRINNSKHVEGFGEALRHVVFVGCKKKGVVL